MPQRAHALQANGTFSRASGRDFEPGFPQKITPQDCLGIARHLMAGDVASRAMRYIACINAPETVHSRTNSMTLVEHLARTTHGELAAESARTATLLIPLLLGLAIIHATVRRLSLKPLPPGPPGIPLLGNVADMPQGHAWFAYKDMAIKYGDVVALRFLGQTLITLNSSTAAFDLLEKRSSIYSDRADSVMMKLTGWDRGLVSMGYGERWREHHRLMWQHLHPNAVQRYHDAQTRGAHGFLRRLLEDKHDLELQVKMTLCAMVVNILYGIPMQDVKPHFLDMLYGLEDGFFEVLKPGAFLVEYFPWLQYMPRWLPGTGWQAKASRWRDQAFLLMDGPWKEAQDAIARGEAGPSLTSEMLEKASQLDESKAQEQVELIHDMTSNMFGGSIHTSSATLYSFFCAMVMHPEVQKRAQAELDAVVGQDRLPEFTDRTSLPYINAIVKETLRWHNITPLGSGHRCMEEDEYRGWRIPKGALILQNVWAILHDPEVYPEPDIFRPERFLRDGQLRSDVLDPARVAFGFGRRICPGRHFAEDLLFINVASVLHTFDILPALDNTGKPIPVTAQSSPALLSHVEKFDYKLRPRNEAALSLAQGEEYATYL
ncbi:cytochrome P450 [Trametes sanguinea]|nr:cytochrome P450 [Trametes sanguinea]